MSTSGPIGPDKTDFANRQKPLSVDCLESRIVLAALAHQTSRTPAERRQAWDTLQRLMQEQKGDA